MKLDILSFAAHPDDAELSCAGTLLKHIATGKKVGIVDLTRGEMGTRGNAETRAQEAAEAARIMGLHARENLGMEDCYFAATPENRNAIIRMIRKYRPETVLANAISDRHPDHGRAAAIVAEASFYSGLTKIETSLDGVPQEPWRPKNVFHYIQDHYLKPDFVVDITGFQDKKMEVISAFKSQFYNPNDNSGPQTAISSKDFWDFLTARAADMGRHIHVKFGEGFTTVRTPGINSFSDLI